MNDYHVLLFSTSPCCVIQVLFLTFVWKVQRLCKTKLAEVVLLVREQKRQVKQLK